MFTYLSDLENWRFD